MSSKSLHNKIDELLGLLSINNNRLSLHGDDISSLDIEVLKKHCVDLYETINRLPVSRRQELAKEPIVEQKKPTQMDQPEVEQPIEQSKVEQQTVEEVKEVKVEKSKQEQTQDDVPKSKPKAEIKVDQSVHERLKDESEMVSLFEKFSSKPIQSIAKEINISKRFEFQNNFFNGDASAYKKFISLLDEATEKEQAFQVYHNYKKEYKWDEHEELKDEIKSLMYRKFAM